MVFFSIVIPLYNKEIFIKEVLNSITCQTFLDYEVIIIDDASTDDSSQVVESFVKEKNISNIILLKNQQNKGVGYTRNKGIDYSNGKYLFLLDADDELSSCENLQIIYQYLISNNIDYLFTLRNYRGKHYRPQFKKIINTISPIEKDLYRVLNKDSFAIKGSLPFGGSGSAIIKRDIAIKNKFNTSENMFEDWDYFIRLFINNESFFLNFNILNVNFDPTTNRNFVGKLPFIYNFLIEKKVLNKTRKRIFWSWFILYLKNNYKLPKTWLIMVSKNFSLNFIILKYQFNAFKTILRVVFLKK